MITVDFSKGHDKVTAPGLYQWDKGQKLAIYGLGVEAAQVHFSNKAAENAIIHVAYKQDAGGLEVDIPNSLLEENSDITAYVYLTSETEGKTVKTVLIPVTARTKPADFISEPDPTQTEIIDELLAKHNETAALVDKYRTFSDVRLVTKEEYDALETKEKNVAYIITDEADQIEKILNGETVVPKAESANKATADANGNDIASTYATKAEVGSGGSGGSGLSADDLTSGAVIPMYASLLKLNTEMESSGYTEENVGLRLTFGSNKIGLYHFRLYREGVIYDLGTLYFDGTYEHTLLGSLSTEADSGATVPYGFYLEAIPYGSTAYYVYVKESGLANTDWITATTKIRYRKIAD